MKSRSSMTLLLILCMLTILAGTSQILHAANDNRLVRIGFYEDGDYMSRNRKNEYVGYNLEFMYEIAKYSGWKYEIVDCRSWNNALSMLENGEIDILPSVFYSQERAKTMLFSAQPISHIYTTLNVRVNDSRYDYEDFASFQGMKVGIIKNTLDGQRFAEYCATNNIDVEIIPIDETPDLTRDLASGVLDGIAITHLGRSSTFRSVAQFNPEPLHVAVSKRRPDLLAQLNTATNTLNTRNPNFLSRLFTKHLSVSNFQDPVFSKAELDYISNNHEITVLYDATWHPLSYTDPKTLKFTGVIADLFAHIADISGLKFRYEPVNGTPLRARTERTPFTVLAGVNSDYLWNSKNNIHSTQIYLRSPLVLVSRGEDMKTGAIALQEGYMLSRKIAEEHPNQTILYYNSPAKCYQALMRGDAQSTYINAHVADYLLSNENLAGVSPITLSNYYDELSIGISTEANPLLFSILDKSLQYTTIAEIEGFVLKNAIRAHSVSWQRVVREHSMAIILFLLVFSCIIIGLLATLLLFKSRTAQRIEKILYKDELTGLPNLNKFRLDATARLHAEKYNEFALIYVDVKQFKTFNDTFGFSEGNRILIAMAEVFQSELQEGELCARISADLFVLLLRHKDWETTAARTARMETRLDEWGHQITRNYQLILVFGVYVTVRGESRDLALMLDFASYAKRSAGMPHKSITVLYDETMRQEGLLQRMLADRMHLSLKDGEFVPYFQPKVDLVTGRLVGCEALARWNFPGKGLLLPERFLPFFEKNGFVTELDLYIYERVCQVQQEWKNTGLAILPVSCNFSRQHFNNPEFPARLTRIADAYNIAYANLELEVTESVFFGNIAQVQEHFICLRKLGFALAIDDFGTGYSSLSLLQQFAVDVMKLDRSFIQKGMHGVREQAVVRGAIQMAKDLSMRVICEGVETIEQEQVLRSMGCDHAQGYYYAPPMPRDEYEIWLYNHSSKSKGLGPLDPRRGP